SAPWGLRSRPPASPGSSMPSSDSPWVERGRCPRHRSWGEAGRSAPRGARRPSEGGPSPPPRELLAEFGVEDLADESVDRDGVEAHVGGHDHPRVDDLPLRELLQHTLELAVRVAVVAPDPQLFALERDLRGVTEAEDAGDEPPVHQ